MLRLRLRRFYKRFLRDLVRRTSGAALNGQGCSRKAEAGTNQHLLNRQVNPALVEQYAQAT